VPPSSLRLTRRTRVANLLRGAAAQIAHLSHGGSRIGRGEAGASHHDDIGTGARNPLDRARLYPAIDLDVHLAAQLIYEKLMQKSRLIVAKDIEYLLQTEVDIDRAVDLAFKRELFQIKDDARPLPPLDGLQIINREVIIRYIRQLLEVDLRLTPFTILGLEKTVRMDHKLSIGAEPVTIRIGGKIDRLDSITTSDGTEQIRVIDYKTGSRRLKALADVDAVFAQESLKDHSDYYLQAFLYSHIVRLNYKDTPVAPALLFIQHAAAEDYDPTLEIARAKINDIRDLYGDFMQGLQGVVNEIFTASLPFKPTEDQTTCASCPYYRLCNT
jgi:hypothetical protein